MKRQPTKLVTWPIFCELQHGDVILTGANRRERLVLIGPADYDDPALDVNRPTSKAYVTVPIHGRSWTNRAYTLLGFSDMRSIYQPVRFYRPRGGARAICGIERGTLHRLGFNWGQEVLRELADIDRLSKLGLEKYKAAPLRWLRRFAERAIEAQQKAEQEAKQ